MQLTLCHGYVRDTGTPLGRGVFAARNFAQGELVEVCPVVLLQSSYTILPAELRQRVFNWAALSKMQEEKHALALGYGSLYNHANPANLLYQAMIQEACIRFVAAVEIAQDEELTINYNGSYGGNVSSEDNWFQATGVKPYVRE